MSKTIRMRVDQEVAAMQTVLNNLLPLDRQAQERVMAFLWDKYVTHPTKAEPNATLRGPSALPDAKKC